MSEYIRSSRSTSYVGCNDCKGLRQVLSGQRPNGMSDCTCHPRWVLFCKRTDDPKLAWIEAELHERGIASRRNGSSFHAPILEVVETDLERADALLSERLPRKRRTIDAMADDDPYFASEWESGPDPIRDGWIGKDGRP